MNTIVPRVAQSRRSLSAPTPRFSHFSRLPDDAQAEAIHRLADQLAHGIEDLRSAIDLVSMSTYQEVTRNREKAPRLVLEAWQGLAVVARALAEPAPKFRPDATGPRPIVRRRRDADAEGVADLRPVSVPFLVEA